MKTKLSSLLAASALLSTLIHPLSTAFAQGTAFTYQGRLNDGTNAANGTYDLTFSAWDAANAGTQVSATLTNSAVAVANGAFTVTLNFGGSVFNLGNDRWLELGVRTNGGGAFGTLTPRQAVTPTPYAMYAGAVNSSGIVGQVTEFQLPSAFVLSHSITNPFNNFAGNGSGLTALNGSQVTSGTVADARLSANVALRSGGNAFTGNQTVVGGNVGIGTASPFTQLANTTNNIYGTDGYGLSTASLGWTSSGFGYAAGFFNPSSGLGGDGVAIGIAGIGTANRILDLWSGGSPSNSVMAVLGNGRVGIGTNNPTTKLDVVGTVKATAFVGDGSGLTNLPIPPGPTNVALLNGGNAFTGDQTVTGGNLGVGTTTTPPKTLTIGGTGNSSLWVGGNDGGAITFPGGTPGNDKAGIRIFNNFIAPGQSTIQGWDYNVNNPRDIVINDAGGKVGIGMNTPSTALEVAGTVKATAFVGDGSGLSNLPSAPLPPNVALLNGTNVFTGPNTLNGVVSATNGNNVFVGSFTGNGSGLTSLPAAQLTGSVPSAALTSVPAANLTGTVADARLSANVALRAGGNTFNGTQNITNGNLGIGTTSPLVPLEVRVTSGRNALFSGPNGANFSFYDVNGGGGNPYLWDMGGDTNAFYISISGVGFPFLIKKSNGFVGINNTTPTTALDVGGTVKATAFVGNGSGLTNLNVNPTNLAGVAMLTGGNTFNGTQNITNGNVGIGTASPTRLLHLKGAGIGMRFEDTLVANSANNNWTIDTDAYGVNGILGIIRYESGSAVEAKSFFFNPSGNVGIGLRNPGTKLDVVGQIRSSVSAGGAYVEMHHASGNGYVNAGTGDLLFNDATTGNVLLGTGGGNVGVNHGSPSAKLQVGGECKATVFTPTSDRNAKQDFTPVNAREVLEKVVALPITEWTYKDIAGARHMGPVAQDFRSAFGLGSDDKGISTVDADGVALASIQALNQKLNEKDAEVQELKQSVEELRELVRSLAKKK